MWAPWSYRPLLPYNFVNQRLLSNRLKSSIFDIRKVTFSKRDENVECASHKLMLLTGISSMPTDSSNLEVIGEEQESSNLSPIIQELLFKKFDQWSSEYTDMHKLSFVYSGVTGGHRLSSNWIIHGFNLSLDVHADISLASGKAVVIRSVRLDIRHAIGNLYRYHKISVANRLIQWEQEIDSDPKADPFGLSHRVDAITFPHQIVESTTGYHCRGLDQNFKDDWNAFFNHLRYLALLTGTMI